MPVLRLTFVLSMLVAFLPSQVDAPAVFGRCARCHGMPDTAVVGDTEWIGRIASTACVQPAGAAGQPTRKGLMEWLGSKSPDRPVVVGSRTQPKAHEGLVRCSVSHGSVLLVPAGGGGEVVDQVRLVFSGERGAAALRAMGEGEWMVRNYRVHRQDDRGRKWQLWGSGARGRRIQVKRGETVRLDLDLAVTVKPMAKPSKKGLRVGLGVSGDSRMGVTVIREGDRVPARYVVGQGDRVLTSGSMAYG